MIWRESRVIGGNPAAALSLTPAAGTLWPHHPSLARALLAAQLQNMILITLAGGDQFFFCHLTLILLERDKDVKERKTGWQSSRDRCSKRGIDRGRLGKARHGEGRRQQEESSGARERRGQEEERWEPEAKTGSNLRVGWVRVPLYSFILTLPCTNSHQVSPSCNPGLSFLTQVDNVPQH